MQHSLITLHRNRLLGRIAIIASLLALTACFVDPDETPQKKSYVRTTDNIHIYQHGDFIEYNVYGPFSPSPGVIQNATAARDG